MKFTEVVKSAGRKLLEANLPFRRAKYGKVSVSVGSWLQVQRRKWKIPEDRLDIYEKAYSYYLEHEFGRPIINLTASATFGKGVQFAGDNEQVAFARKLFSDLDLFQVGIESAIYGDNFIRLFNKDSDGKETDQIKLAMLPPSTIQKIPKESNVLEVDRFEQQFETSQTPEIIGEDEMIHIMINAVSDSLYGNSDLLHLFYHLDMYNSLVEEADKRRLFASQPVWVFGGVDLRYRAALKSRIGDVTRDKDQKEGIRRSVPPGSVFYLPKGMTLESIEPAGKFDLESMVNRVAKVIAMSSETPLHWLNLTEQVALKTAKESQWPFIKKIQRRQTLFVAKFEELLRKVYVKLGDKFPHDEENKQGEFKLQVVFPPIFDYELEEIQKMVQSILNTNMAGKLSDKSTLDLICNYFGLDVEKEEEKLGDEKKKEAQEEFGQVEKAVGEIGRAVAKGELEKDVATKLINKILEKK